MAGLNLEIADLMATEALKQDRQLTLNPLTTAVS